MSAYPLARQSALQSILLSVHSCKSLVVRLISRLSDVYQSLRHTSIRAIFLFFATYSLTYLSFIHPPLLSFVSASIHSSSYWYVCPCVSNSLLKESNRKLGQHISESVLVCFEMSRTWKWLIEKIEKNSNGYLQFVEGINLACIFVRSFVFI